MLTLSGRLGMSYGACSHKYTYYYDNPTSWYANCVGTEERANATIKEFTINGEYYKVVEYSQIFRIYNSKGFRIHEGWLSEYGSVEYLEGRGDNILVSYTHHRSEILELNGMYERATVELF